MLQKVKTFIGRQDWVLYYYILMVMLFTIAALHNASHLQWDLFAAHIASAVILGVLATTHILAEKRKVTIQLSELLIMSQEQLIDLQKIRIRQLEKNVEFKKVPNKTSKKDGRVQQTGDSK